MLSDFLRRTETDVSRRDTASTAAIRDISPENVRENNLPKE